jgi:hypothetical protein
MAQFVLTVVTTSRDFFHSAHDTEEEAKKEQADLLAQLNDPVGPQFVQVGASTVRLRDIASTKVSPEGQAPGYNVGVVIA